MAKNEFQTEGTSKPKTVSKEKKAKYNQTKKENARKEREKRKQEIQNNEIANRRLAFLINIFNATGVNKNEIARRIGTTQQAMSWYFSVKDDCRLTQAKKFLDVIGLTLDVEIKRPEQKTKPINLSGKKAGNNEGVKFTIEGDLENITRWVNPKMPEYINACTPDKNLYFLAEYIPTCGRPITELMKDCEIDLTSLRYAFFRDDIKISQIFNIAKATGGEIVWKVNKK